MIDGGRGGIVVARRCLKILFEFERFGLPREQFSRGCIGRARGSALMQGGYTSEEINAFIKKAIKG